MSTFTMAATDVGLYAKTLAASTEDRVTVNRSRSGDAIAVTVISDGAAALYFTTDGTAAVVAAVNTYELPAGVVSRLSVLLPVGVTEVRLISAGTPKYSVSRN
jgi:hypothetical protein